MWCSVCVVCVCLMWRAYEQVYDDAVLVVYECVCASEVHKAYSMCVWCVCVYECVCAYEEVETMRYVWCMSECVCVSMCGVSEGV